MTPDAPSLLAALRHSMRADHCPGIPEALLQPFFHDTDLCLALQQAQATQQALQQQLQDGTLPALLAMSEADAINQLQQGFQNFYSPLSATPFIPLAAQGPWIISSHGAVIMDVGGYGKDPLGHCPPALQAILAEPLVMMNVMTAQPTQWRLHHTLAQTLGLAPSAFKIQMLNSGSEAVELALTYVERHMQALHRSCTPQPTEYWLINLLGGFHGRTGRAARVSNSTQVAYQQAGLDATTPYRVKTLLMNDSAALQTVFLQAKQCGAQLVGMIMEMVQGEGNPGAAVTPAYYRLASQLCQQVQALLIVDSVQAGWRAYGTFSPLSATAFKKLPRPAIEIFSKAIHGGIYPCSLLVIDTAVATSFARGTYGNTMTANPKACELIIRMTQLMTPGLQADLQARSAQWLAGLQQLQQRFPLLIERVQGTGLLLSMKIRRRADQTLVWPVMGEQGLERLCRQQGLNVIHGGQDDCLRFTPAFTMTPSQVQLALTLLDRVLTQVFGQLDQIC
jgi:acetylornithine/succinyldiaminopimelate/putrescine aminotransferase